MSATGDTEERKDEQVISSPPTLNRVSKTLHDHGEDTSSASESGPSSHGPATGGRKTVSSLLKDALGSLDALIENSNIPKDRSNKIKSDVRKERRPANRQSRPSPNLAVSSQASDIRDGYTRTTACWESRFVASHTEREYRRAQDEELKSSIKVAWVSPKSKKREARSSYGGNNSRFNHGPSSTPNKDFGNNSIDTPSRITSTHDRHLSATTIKSPRSSVSNQDIVTSTKSVNQSWGHRWGLRGASPTPRLDGNTVHTTTGDIESSPSNSYANRSKVFSNRKKGEKSSADIYVNSSKVTDHTQAWIEKRREMVQQETLAKAEQKKLDAAFGFRNMANNNTNMAAYVPQLPSRLNYNEDFDISRISLGDDEFKSRQKAAIAAAKVAKEAKQYEEDFAKTEIELEILVHSLPKDFRKAVTKRILDRRRFLYHNCISRDSRKYKLRQRNADPESQRGEKPAWSIPISPVSSPAVEKRNRRPRKSRKAKSSEEAPETILFQTEAFEKHIKKQEKAREYRAVAASIFSTGKSWTKSPTKAEPFNLTTSRRAQSKKLKVRPKSTAHKTKRKMKKKIKSKTKLQRAQHQTVSSQAKKHKSGQRVVKKKRKKKRKVVAKEKQRIANADAGVDTPVKTAAGELLSMK